METCHECEIAYWPEDGCRLCKASAEIERLNAQLAEKREEEAAWMQAIDQANKNGQQYDELNAELELARAQLADFQASQHYRYIGKDGKPVLARDLEIERDELRTQVIDLKTQLALAGPLFSRRELERQRDEMVKVVEGMAHDLAVSEMKEQVASYNCRQLTKKLDNIQLSWPEKVMRLLRAAWGRRADG